MKISVVIPTYNQAQFIETTIRSVLQQTYTNLEIVVADDASTDGTAEIIRRYAAIDKRIKPLFATQNMGIARNFNRAFDACTGKYVAFLGGDDIMLPEKLEIQIEFLEKNPEYAMCLHYTEVFDSETNKTAYLHKDTNKEKIPRNPLEWIFPTKWFFTKLYTSIIPSACLARAEYYLHARYDERLTLKHELLFTLDDYMANPQGKWHVIPKVLVRYRLHENNFSRQQKMNEIVEEEKNLLAAIAYARYPQIGRRIKRFVDFTLFESLLFDWVERDKRKYYVKQFWLRAGALKFLYLMICRIMLKINILFPLFKPVGFILRKIGRQI